jgi:hypothetical protein
MKQRLAEAKAQNEARLAASQRATDRIERQKILQGINARKQAANPPPSRTESAPVNTQSAPAPPPAARRDCTLKLVFDDGSSIVGVFSNGDELGAVAEFVEGQRGRKGKIAFETAFPKRLLNEEVFGSTLAELQIGVRDQILVKYL